MASRMLRLCLSGFILLMATAQLCDAKIYRGAGLSTKFYNSTCPSAEKIVKQKVVEILTNDRSLAAGLLRLHFHDCFVDGCDASVLIDSTASNQAEKDAPPNFRSLRGFQEVDEIKAALESECPGVVSCSDILALVARDSVVQVGGPTWSVPLGRRDGRVSSLEKAKTRLPSPLMDFPALVNNFKQVGLTTHDMVVLSGAHTIGFAQCGPILPRLYNFSATKHTDPSINPTFAASLKSQCPPGAKANIIEMNPTKGNNNVFDNAYFKNVGAHRGVFSSDATLLSGGRSIVLAEANSKDTFFTDFAAAMVKMGRISPLLGSVGEIRKSCAVFN